MFEPDYVVHSSLIGNVSELHGNLELADNLRALVKQKYVNVSDLYTAQEEINEYCIKQYGADFYERSGAAINYIIENEYCNKERENNGILDKERYAFDRECRALY